MAHQLTFADNEFHNKRRKTRKEVFLEVSVHFTPLFSKRPVNHTF